MTRGTWFYSDIFHERYYIFENFLIYWNATFDQEIPAETVYEKKK